VRGQARPDPRDADELHDALMTVAVLTPDEVDAPLFAELARAARATCAGGRWYVAAERMPELLAIHPAIAIEPVIAPPPSRMRSWTRDAALVELVRGRMTIAGPATAAELAACLDVDERQVDAALLALESEGTVLRGLFSSRAERSEPAKRRASEARVSEGPEGTGAERRPRAPREWCDRALLARIHRQTVERLRAEIEPVSPADFMRFLFKWQHVDRADRLCGIDGLREAVSMLDGYELAASAWERAVLPARVDGYEPSMLDMLCLSGEVGWGRLSGPGEVPRLTPATPIALHLRDHAAAWQALRARGEQEPARLGPSAVAVLTLLRERGASFFADIRQACGLDADQAGSAVGALVACGLVASDGFSGLRALMWTGTGRPAPLDRRASFAGRWTLTASPPLTDRLGAARASAASEPRERSEPAMRRARERAGESEGQRRSDENDPVEEQAWALLRRYGVICRRLAVREMHAAPWRELVRVYRRLEARGEIRGGRFAGLPGEQFALPRAVERLREVRRTPPDGRVLCISAADPLNLAGIVTAGERVRARARTRIAYRDGVPVAVREGDVVRQLVPVEPEDAARVSRALSRSRLHPAVAAH
jgi:ATP-dependent Lhr-like helicase